MKQKLLEYLEMERKSLYDPNGEGITEDEAFKDEGFYMDEGQQSRMRCLNEIIQFIKGY